MASANKHAAGRNREPSRSGHISVLSVSLDGHSGTNKGGLINTHGLPSQYAVFGATSAIGPDAGSPIDHAVDL